MNISVQVGAFSIKSNADAQLKKVKAAGFETYMVKVNNMYKIQVGVYSVKANADAMLSKVQVVGFDAFITTEQGERVSNTTPVKKTSDEIAKEIYHGQCSDSRWDTWGNGSTRVERLTAAGYDANEVQKAVNALF